MRAAEERDRFLVDEMLQHLAVVALAVKEGRDQLDSSRTARYALEHATELLAEAGEKTSRQFKSANTEIPWEVLRKFRHDVAHPYDLGASRVDKDQMWRFARDDAPRIERRLRRARFP
jgi:uncharacterized protein with HEPN domain